VLTNKKGGIVDDLIITKITPEKFFFVYNAGCRAKDESHITAALPAGLKFTPLDKSLIALQGKKAEGILQDIFPSVPQKYMTMEMHDDIYISRLGYTGEDGFEISVPNDKAAELWNKILANPLAKPVGLGARDSLRLEMGYPLYGHDINDNTTPIEASLGWIMPKDKRASFPAPKTKRIGIEMQERGIVREGAEIFNSKDVKIGTVTSGGYSPYLNKPLAQGYVEVEYAGLGMDVKIELRGRKIPAKIAPLFFMKPRTKQ
jgi:aminomethyltransferase